MVLCLLTMFLLQFATSASLIDRSRLCGIEFPLGKKFTYLREVSACNCTIAIPLYYMAKRISFFLLRDKILIYNFVHLIHFYPDNWVWPHQVTFEEKKNTVFVLVSSFSFKPYKEIFHPLSQIKIL